MRTQVVPDADAVAREGARFIAGQAREAVRARGRFLLAVSGGRTPWAMLRLLAEVEVPWEHVHVFQVDERVAPAGHRERNLTHLRASLLGRTPLAPERLHAMAVEEAVDLEGAARAYQAVLERHAGAPAVLDLVHLGLGTDGHTASLVPGDPVLEVSHVDVAVTGPYEGRRRMTLTYPLLARARRILWIVTGVEKAAMLARLRAADASIPAGRVPQDRATLLTDLADGEAEGPGV